MRWNSCKNSLLSSTVIIDDAAALTVLLLLLPLWLLSWRTSVVRLVAGRPARTRRVAAPDGRAGDPAAVFFDIDTTGRVRCVFTAAAPPLPVVLIAGRAPAPTAARRVRAPETTATRVAQRSLRLLGSREAAAAARVVVAVDDGARLDFGELLTTRVALVVRECAVRSHEAAIAVVAPDGGDGRRAAAVVTVMVEEAEEVSLWLCRRRDTFGNARMAVGTAVPASPAVTAVVRDVARRSAGAELLRSAPAVVVVGAAAAFLVSGRVAFCGEELPESTELASSIAAPPAATSPRMLPACRLASPPRVV